jgi:hypothetical protein
MKRNKAFILFATVSLALGVVMGCKEPESLTPVPATTPSTEAAKVMFINGSPDAPTLQGQLNNADAGTSLTLGTGSGYSSTQVGAVLETVKGSAGPIGGVLGSGVVTNRPTLLTNTSYTLVVTDTLNRAKSGTDPGGLRVTQLTDNLTAPAAGKSGVRFLNLAPGLAPVFVTVGTTNLSGSFTYRTFGAAFTQVPSGTITIKVRTGSLTGTVVAQADNVVLTDGKIYTLFIQGRPGKTGAQALKVGTVVHN